MRPMQSTHSHLINSSSAKPFAPPSLQITSPTNDHDFRIRTESTGPQPAAAFRRQPLEPEADVVSRSFKIKNASQSDLHSRENLPTAKTLHSHDSRRMPAPEQRRMATLDPAAEHRSFQQQPLSSQPTRLPQFNSSKQLSLPPPASRPGAFTTGEQWSELEADANFDLRIRSLEARVQSKIKNISRLQDQLNRKQTLADSPKQVYKRKPRSSLESKVVSRSRSRSRSRTLSPTGMDTMEALKLMDDSSKFRAGGLEQLLKSNMKIS